MQLIARTLEGIAKAHLHSFDPIELTICAKKYQQQLAAIAAAEPLSERQRSLAGAYFDSGACRLTALVLALKGRSVACGKILAQDMYAQIPYLSPYQDCGEALRVRFKRKLDAAAGSPSSSEMPIGYAANANVQLIASPQDIADDYRTICQFGLIRRAQQMMARSVLSVAVSDDGIDYAVAGRGHRAAIGRVETILRAGEHPWVVVGDIRNCFGSVKQKYMHMILPLKRKVIEHVLFNHEVAPIEVWDRPTCITHENAKRKAREGIPQGSLVSPLVARILLGPDLKAAALGGEIVCHADDFLVFARSENESHAIVDALTERFKQHPSGPFAFKHLDVKSVEDWFAFLGSRMRCVSTPSGRAIEIAPTNKSFHRFADKLMGKIADGWSLPDIERYIIRWASLWDWSKVDEDGRCLFEAAAIQAAQGAGIALEDAVLKAARSLTG